MHVWYVNMYGMCVCMYVVSCYVCLRGMNVGTIYNVYLCMYDLYVCMLCDYVLFYSYMFWPRRSEYVMCVYYVTYELCSVWIYYYAVYVCCGVYAHVMLCTYWVFVSMYVCM